MEYIKKNYKYYLCFLIIFLSLLFFGYNNTDSIWNYGMAHAINIGEIPYKDFNIITTPLYAFYMSIFLKFYDQYITFLFAQSLLGTIGFYFLDKMLGKKISFILTFIAFELFLILFPNYNFLVLVLIIILMYLEKNNENDKLIGLVLGLLVLTKHTMGIVIVLLSFISTFNIKRCLNRTLGMLLPGFIFLLYLIINKAFIPFWNLSIMGLFDFGNDNKFVSVLLLIILLIALLYSLYCIRKNPKDPINYYMLGSLFFAFPIVDFFHMQYILFLFIVKVLLDIKKIEKPYYVLCVVVFVVLTFFNTLKNIDTYKNIRFSDLPHFKGYLMHTDFYNNTKLVYKDYKNRDNVYMFGFSNMFFDIAADHKITYFDIPLYGNFGYDGVNKMKKDIDKMHNVYFYVSTNDNIQFCDELYDYIVEKSEYQYSVWNNGVYYKK